MEIGELRIIVDFVNEINKVKGEMDEEEEREIINKIYYKYYKIILEYIHKDLILGEPSEEHQSSEELQQHLINDLMMSCNDYTDLYL